MKVLLVGGGGREHALAWRILQSSLVDSLYVTHANPGFPEDAIPLGDDVVEGAVQAGVGLVVIGPEAPLAEGLADRFRAAGVLVFGPSQAAAELETSKEYAKSFMDRHRIPTGHWTCHTNLASAIDAVNGPCVVKADGLAAGKGVIVADSAEEAVQAVERMFDGAFGEAGQRVLIEERLSGPEVSFLAICDGERAIPLLPCRDHKRRFEADGGPNTGGMGAICPPADVSAELVEEIRETVLQRAVDGMAMDGRPFQGVLYAGVMLTQKGPKVLEFNVRFGDPECQPLMLMLEEDLVPILCDAAAGDLEERPLKWRNGAACCVVMVSGGYPGPITKGHPISGVPDTSANGVVFYAGASRAEGQVVTSGGRVLGVTAHGGDLAEAAQRAYSTVQKINFETAAWRTDIGGKSHGK